MSTISVTWERPQPVPGAPAGRLARWRRTLTKTVTSTVRVAFTPHKASLRRLADIPLMLIGIGFADTAAWQGPHWLGWLATGLSLVVVEHLIADPDESQRYT
jgi:hypothetical protein